jgi:hypothetical protein
LLQLWPVNQGFFALCSVRSHPKIAFLMTEIWSQIKDISQSTINRMRVIAAASANGSDAWKRLSRVYTCGWNLMAMLIASTGEFA